MGFLKPLLLAKSLVICFYLKRSFYLKGFWRVLESFFKNTIFKIRNIKYKWIQRGCKVFVDAASVKTAIGCRCSRSLLFQLKAL